MGGAEELADRRAAYGAAVQAERARSLATERIARLIDERDRAVQRLGDLQREAALEGDEAAEWADKGFLQLVYWLFGRLDERRDLEASQAVAAAARLATAQSVLDEVERTLAEARSSVPQAADVAAALHALRSTWAAVDPKGYAATVALETTAADTRALLSEHDEAIEAVDSCIAASRVAEERLGSARAWGTYDLLGGGLISSAIKRERVARALSAIESTTAGIAHGHAHQSPGLSRRRCPQRRRGERRSRCRAHHALTPTIGANGPVEFPRGSS
jgi:hypothetical protein